MPQDLFFIKNICAIFVYFLIVNFFVYFFILILWGLAILLLLLYIFLAICHIFYYIFLCVITGDGTCFVLYYSFGFAYFPVVSSLVYSFFIFLCLFSHQLLSLVPHNLYIMKYWIYRLSFTDYYAF